MSMISVKPALGVGGVPQEEIVRQIALRHKKGTISSPLSLSGLGADTAAGSSWADWLQNLATSWSSAGQQVLINQNPATASTTGPGGTTTYYSTTAVPVASTAAASSGSAMILLAAGAVILVMMMSKR